MTSRSVKRLLIGGGAVIVLLIVALLAAPVFIDVNAYKPEIAAQVKRATGRDLVLEGPISLSLLPTPEIRVADVKFFNMAGSKNSNMVEVKSVSVKPALLPLLAGTIEASEVILVEPKIVLEINAAGKPNWEFAPSVAEAKPAAPRPASPRPLSLGRLVIDNGTLIFSDAKDSLSVVAEKADFTAAVGSIDGPYSLAGSATVNGAPFKIDLAVSAKGSSGHGVDLSLQGGGGRLAVKATLSELGRNARLVGVATVSADSLTTFIATLVKLTGQPEPALPSLLAGKFSFDGAIDVSQTAFAAKDFKMMLGEDSGSGSLAVAWKPSLAIEGKVVLPKIDLDRTLAALSQPVAAAATKPAAAGGAPPPSGGLPANLTLRATLDIGELIYNKKPVRNVTVELDARGGAVAVPKLSATLPGDMVLQARSTMSGDPARPIVSGDFSLVGPKLRETLAWLDVDVSSLPSGKFTRLSLKGKMASSGGNVQVSDAQFELDDVKGTGGIVVTFGVPLSVVTHVELDTLDLDSYLAPAAQKQAASSAPLAAASAHAPAVAGPTVGLKARVAKLIYHKETIGGVDIDVALQGSTLRLNDVKVSNLVGARLAVRGTVANYSAAALRADVAFNFEAPDMSRVLKLVGATAPAGLGAVTASGGVAGSLEQLILREVTVNGLGESLKASGTLALPGAIQGTPKSAAYKGSLVLNGQAIEGSIDATLTAPPYVTADLRAGVLDLDKIGGSPSAARTPPRGQPTAAKPIETGPLRGVNGNFKLVAASLVSPTLRIGNADLAATLKDGVLTIAHFKGNLYGGSIALAGVVNGSQPTLSFDLRGDASNIYLGDMLRSTSGSNQFGGTIKVTIDGKLNASGITVRGSGSTADQLRSSMVGGAQLSGHVFVGADKALQVLGTAAAGVAGGVIDNTLGNVLGAVGAKGGLGVGNLLNAISLMLNRFVNHDSPISGHVDVAGGVLTDKGLVVQGNRATATIATRTNLGNSTTDTTITFRIAEDSSAPYLITTARGALSSPSLNVERGAAKDPPGMASTLPGANTLPAPNTIPGIGNLLPGQGGSGQQAPPRSPIPNVPIPNIPNIPNIFGR